MFAIIEKISSTLGLPKGMVWSFIILMFGGFGVYSLAKGAYAAAILLMVVAISILIGCIDKYNL